MSGTTIRLHDLDDEQIEERKDELACASTAEYVRHLIRQDLQLGRAAQGENEHRREEE